MKRVEGGVQLEVKRERERRGRERLCPVNIIVYKGDEENVQRDDNRDKDQNSKEYTGLRRNI